MPKCRCVTRTDVHVCTGLFCFLLYSCPCLFINLYVKTRLQDLIHCLSLCPSVFCVHDALYDGACGHARVPAFVFTPSFMACSMLLCPGPFPTCLPVRLSTDRRCCRCGCCR
jgi:hypothetical protein